MEDDVYKRFALRLNELPNGFPPTDDGSELRLLQWLCTPEEAELASKLRLIKETPSQIAERIGGDSQALRITLKGMAKKGVIAAARTESGLGYGLMPFVVGIYEMQHDRINGELAHLFEDYYQKGFGQIASEQPQVHRIVPVGESVRVDMEVHPHESVTDIINKARSWGVVDCLCRKQKALIGQPCPHPLDVCMVMSEVPGTFDHSSSVRGLTLDEALHTLKRAAAAGLVHSVSNNQQGLWYICNCCTCSCGILRGMVDLGVANIIARSSFVLQINETRCSACGVCLERCQFGALSLDMFAVVDTARCVGCGVCTIKCPEDAMTLIRRQEDEIKTPPVTLMDWMEERANHRGLAIDKVL